MIELQKEAYIPPEARILSFVPKEAIGAPMGDMTDENAFTYFDSGAAQSIISGEVIDPDTDLG